MSSILVRTTHFYRIREIHRNFADFFHIQDSIQLFNILAFSYPTFLNADVIAAF